MKKLIRLQLLFCVLLACQNNYNEAKYSYELIPSASEVVLKINELNDFVGSIKNHTILSKIYNDDLKKASKILKHLNTNQSTYIALSEESENASNYLILTENNPNLFITDSLPNIISERLTDFNINKTQLENTTIYHKIIGTVFAASNNLELLKTLNSNTENTELKRLIATTNPKSVASIIFKSNHKDYSKLLFSSAKERANFSNYTTLDIGYTTNSINYNGVSIANDSITSAIDVFKHTKPQKINAVKIAPKTTTALKSITYNDFLVLNTNLNQLNNKNTDNTQTFLNFTNEIAQLDNAVIAHALDTDMAMEAIVHKTRIETFKTVEIFQFEAPTFFDTQFLPFITFKNAKFFAVYNEFLVFSDSIAHLKAILTNAINNNTLANSEAYKTISKNFSDEASLFIYKNSEGLSDLLGTTLKGYNANAVQFTYENNYAHVVGTIQKYKKKAALNTITERFAIKLNADLIAPPQTLKNHITKARDIVVQDVNNVLYLISNAGTILWKKQLKSKLLGTVKQLDLFKNGELQLAFTTANALYVLDRSGKAIAPFPIKFNDEITQPLSVFDYDNTHNYRLLITQNNTLVMYNKKGKLVNGFNYKSDGHVIATQPKHFRIGSKDYIAFTAGETLHILNRKGQTRIALKDKIKFSGNPLFLYQNKFTTTNTLGELIQVDAKGNLSTKTLNLPNKHYLETTSKTLVTMLENTLKIKSRLIDLDYGDYSKPRIFYLNDKIYVTTTDRQAKKVYLFDSQAKPIANFPVYGTAAAEICNIDGTNQLELVTQLDERTLVVYNIN